MMRSVFEVLFACGVAVSFAASASAETPGGDTLQIDLSASIAQRCGIAPVGSTAMTNASLDRAESRPFDFAIDCNTPFAIGVQSRGGGLRLAGQGALDTGGDGFSIIKPYLVALNLQTDNGALNGGTCDAADLTGAGACQFYGASSGQGLSSGQRTAIRRTGALTVSWTANESEARRAAGTYEDTLTIIVGPRT